MLAHEDSLNIFVDRLNKIGLSLSFKETEYSKEVIPYLIKRYIERLGNKTGYFLAMKKLYKEGHLSHKFFSSEKTRFNIEMKNLFLSILRQFKTIEVDVGDTLVNSILDEIIIKGNKHFKTTAKKYVLDYYKEWKQEGLDS